MITKIYKLKIHCKVICQEIYPERIKNFLYAISLFLELYNLSNFHME